MTKRYEFEITGKQPLLMHWDNVEFADKLKAWRNQPSNKNKSVPGDDRSPPFSWMGCLYNEEGKGDVFIPSENIMKALMEGGASVRTGRGQGTFKAQTQSGMLVDDLHVPLLVDGKTIPMDAVNKIEKLEEFSQHVEAVKALGFDLFVKRATVGSSKHIRVRPLFPRWSLRGVLQVWDDMLKLDVLRTIFEVAGSSKGLCDWRPSSPRKPGPYGTFTTQIRAI
jgi:hypothetical protein